jgi:hypothetical protein
MNKFYVSKTDYVKDLNLEDGTIFFRKSYKNGDCYVINEFYEHAEYMRSLIDSLSEDEGYDLDIIKKEMF